MSWHPCPVCERVTNRKAHCISCEVLLGVNKNKRPVYQGGKDSKIVDLPREVNIDTIRDLKKRGLGYEALMLLDAFHENGKKNKMNLERELFNQEYQKKRTIRLHHGLCPTCGNEKDDDTKKTCGICREKSRRETKRRKRKYTGNCHNCGLSVPKPRIYCSSRCTNGFLTKIRAEKRKLYKV